MMGSGIDFEELPDFEDKEKLSDEAQLLGIYVSGHPLDKVRDIVRQMVSMEIAQVHEAQGQDKRDMVLAGLITGKKEIITKKGDKMCFAQLEDLSGKIECIVFPRTFQEYAEILKTDEPVIMTGKVNLSEEPRKFFPEKIQKLEDQAEERVTGVRISVKIDELSTKRLERLKQVVLSYRGTVPMHVIFEADYGKARISLPEDFLVNPTPQMATKINEVFDRNIVQFIVDGRLENVSTLTH